MSKKDSHTSSATDNEMSDLDDSQGNVDKIRDIIFGSNMRDYERRFAALEQRIVNDNRRLSDDLHARFEQLDTYMRKEFSLHGERAAAERKERLEALDEQSAQLADARKAMENKIADVDESLAVAAQEIRTRLHNQGSELLEMIRRAKEDLSTSIRQEAHQLQDAKVAREDLAALLQAMALQLGRDADTDGDTG